MDGGVLQPRPPKPPKELSPRHLGLPPSSLPEIRVGRKKYRGRTHREMGLTHRQRRELERSKQHAKHTHSGAQTERHYRRYYPPKTRHIPKFLDIETQVHRWLGTQEEKEVVNEEKQDNNRLKARQMFDVIDEDHSETLQLSEIQEALKKLGQDLTIEEIEQQMASIDKKVNGQIDFDEFLHAFDAFADWTDVLNAKHSPKTLEKNGAALPFCLWVPAYNRKVAFEKVEKNLAREYQALESYAQGKRFKPLPRTRDTQRKVRRNKKDRGPGAYWGHDQTMRIRDVLRNASALSATAPEEAHSRGLHGFRTRKGSVVFSNVPAKSNNDELSDEHEMWIKKQKQMKKMKLKKNLSSLRKLVRSNLWVDLAKNGVDSKNATGSVIEIPHVEGLPTNENHSSNDGDNRRIRKAVVFGYDSHYGNGLSLATVTKRQDGKGDERTRLRDPGVIPLREETVNKGMPSVEVEWTDRMLSIHETQVGAEADVEPLHAAVKKAVSTGQWQELQYFIHSYGGNNKADWMAFCNRCDVFGCPIIIRAAIQGQHKVVEVLLFHGANPNLRDKKEDVAINFACIAKDKRMVGLLLDNGAQTDITNWQNKSCYSFCDEEMAKFVHDRALIAKQNEYEDGESTKKLFPANVMACCNNMSNLELKSIFTQNNSNGYHDEATEVFQRYALSNMQFTDVMCPPSKNGVILNRESLEGYSLSELWKGMQGFCHNKVKKDEEARYNKARRNQVFKKRVRAVMQLTMGGDFNIQGADDHLENKLNATGSLENSTTEPTQAYDTGPLRSPEPPADQR